MIPTLLESLAKHPALADWLAPYMEPAEIEASRAELLSLSERWPRADLDTMGRLLRRFEEEWFLLAKCVPDFHPLYWQVVKEMESEIREAERYAADYRRVLMTRY